MATKRTKRQNAVSGLTTLETEILEIMWARGKSSVRDVHEIVLKDKYIPYTTVAAVMKNLAGKGVLKQTKVGKAFYFAPKMDRFEVAKQIIDAVVDKVLLGSAAQIAAYLLERKLKPEEFAELKKKFAG